MSLLAGSRIGSFVIVAPLGAGGMGEVYRASDTKLGRDVALKILPEAFAGDAERLARFEREARMLASLNHPLIAQIYGVEVGPPPAPGHPPLRALVMELVEGEDLAQRLQHGPLPVREAIAIARQIAEALDAAHELGVIHRDLKPGNIRIRDDGTIKLLDFGLAKPTDAGTGFNEVFENSPTITSPAITERGVILGTAAYMAPEQAIGKVVDKRADVWALGVVLYEMLSGRRPFSGASSTEVIAQILEREVDWTTLPAETPAHVRQLLQRCLQKDRRSRMRDCGDVMLELGESAIEASSSHRSASWSPWAIAGAIGIAIGVSVAMLAGPFRAAPQTGAAVGIRQFALVQSQDRLATLGRLPVAVSRDGRTVVFSGDRQLLIRSVDELLPRPIPGTEAVTVPTGERGNTGVAIQPILSPDGESVAYAQGGRLKRVAVTGGVPSVICDCGAVTHGATWSDDNTILFTNRTGSTDNGIWRVPAAGGTAEQVIAIPPNQTALMPQLLPGGRHVLFTVTRGAHWNESDVVVQALGSTERRVVVERGIDGRYLDSGHLAYGKDGVIHAVKFDVPSLRTSGSAVPVLTGVAQQTSAGNWGGFAYVVSGEGTAVYVPADAEAARRALVWIDRTGREEVLPAEPRSYQYPRMSRDGLHVVLDLRDQQNDVWSWDLTRATLTRVTQGRFAGGPAIWNRAGDGVIYGPDVDGVINLHSLPTSGGAPRRLATSANNQFVDDLTPDGQWLVMAERDPKTGFNLRRLPVNGSGDPVDLLATPFNELNADVSPDGRWIAYQSDESGRNEVFVRPFPEVKSGRWQVSSAGGTRPLWSHDGRELFFLDASRRMTIVAVRQDPALEFGVPQALFETAQLGLEGQQRNFDLSPDGKRFLMVRNLPPPADVPTLVVIQNWFDLVRARVR